MESGLSDAEPHWYSAEARKEPLFRLAALTVPMILLGWKASSASAGSGIRLVCAGAQMLFFSHAFFHLITRRIADDGLTVEASLFIERTNAGLIARRYS